MIWKALWAKSSPKHLLWRHLIDVGAVVRCLWADVYSSAQRNRIAAAFGLDEGETQNLVCWLAAMHDVGKAAPGFQNQRPELIAEAKAAGLPFPDSTQKIPHGEVSADIISNMLEQAGWPRLFSVMAARASGGHHGIPSNTSDVIRKAIPINVRPQWAEGHVQLAAAVEQALGLHRPEKPSSEQHLAALGFLDIAGLISFADWIGSSETYFANAAQSPSTPEEPELYGLWALGKASMALESFGWRAIGIPSVSCDYTALFPHVFSSAEIEPRPLQKKVADILSANPETRLLLIEAPMGEGKTEAALYAARFWMEKHQQKGVYLALPTQATSNAMYRRFLRWIETLGLAEPPDLHVLHSGLKKDDTYLKAIHATRIGQLFDDQDGPLPATAHEWFLASKRGLLAPFGIGTIDQALLGILVCKHHFVRLHGLAGKTVVLDEVHAYDVYTGSLLDRLLEYLGKMGATVVLLSATLPARRREELVRAFSGEKGMFEKAPYPRITSSDISGKCSTSSFPAGREKTAVVLERLSQDLEAAVSEFISRIGDGGCGAFIFNTVGDCQEAYRFARGILPAEEVYILHSRFTAGKRAELEGRLLSAFGKDGNRPARAIVVASQVIEQSLDLDFDIMATELAPIDLMLQRLGRMHRHPGRERGQHCEPRLLVRESRKCVPGHPDFTHHIRIYDPKILFRTKAALIGRKNVTIPDDMDGLISLVYDESRELSIPEEWTQAYQNTAKLSAEELARRARFAQERSIRTASNDETLAEFWESVCQHHMHDEDEAWLHRDSRPMTRLGEDSLRVLCLYRLDDRLHLDRKGDIPVTGTTPLPDILLNAATISAVHVRRDGLKEIHVVATRLPEWSGKGILRYLPVLEFDGDAVCQLSGVRITLDEEVGICFS